MTKRMSKISNETKCFVCFLFLYFLAGYLFNSLQVNSKISVWEVTFTHIHSNRSYLSKHVTQNAVVYENRAVSSHCCQSSSWTFLYSALICLWLDRGGYALQVGNG